MGISGARYSDHVGSFADELRVLGELSWKKMFGGADIFVDGSMVALINSDAELHLKVDDSNRSQFEEAGVVRHARMTYYAVPADILEDREQLLEWAGRSARIAKS
jgi:DNA transformation protein